MDIKGRASAPRLTAKPPSSAIEAREKSPLKCWTEQLFHGRVQILFEEQRAARAPQPAGTEEPAPAKEAEILRIATLQITIEMPAILSHAEAERCIVEGIPGAGNYELVALPGEGSQLVYRCYLR
jgi:hypothetical protein